MRKNILLMVLFKKLRYGGFLKAKVNHLDLNIPLPIYSITKGYLAMIITSIREIIDITKTKNILMNFKDWKDYGRTLIMI